MLCYARDKDAVQFFYLKCTLGPKINKINNNYKP
jgi:hypothetical protein